MEDNKLFEHFSGIMSRLASMEGKIDMFVANEAYVRKAIDELSERAAKTEAAAKSAHKRLDVFEQARKEDKEFMRWAIGIGVAISGVVSGLVVHFLGR